MAKTDWAGHSLRGRLRRRGISLVLRMKPYTSGCYPIPAHNGTYGRPDRASFGQSLAISVANGNHSPVSAPACEMSVAPTEKVGLGRDAASVIIR